MDIYTRDQLREFDRWAVEDLGIPEQVLIENASRGACEIMHGLGLPDECVVFCGGGNNGADGAALARHLLNRGVAVSVVLVGDPEKYGTELKRQIAILQKWCPDALMKLEETDEFPEETCTGTAVDAVFGIGFSGAVRPFYARVFELIRRFDRVVSLDLPSGIDADAVTYDPAAVRADVTISFVAGKPAFADERCAPHCGDIYVTDIGVV